MADTYVEECSQCDNETDCLIIDGKWICSECIDGYLESKEDMKGEEQDYESRLNK